MTAPSPPPSRRRWVIGALLVVLVGLVVLCALLLTGGLDTAAKANLVATVNALQRSHQHQRSHGFGALTLDQLHRSVPAVTFVSGSTDLSQPTTATVAISLCATGTSCDGVVMATRGADGTCWYGALALSPTAARSLGFRPGVIGVQYGVSAHSARCQAEHGGRVVQPRSGWGDDMPAVAAGQ